MLNAGGFFDESPEHLNLLESRIISKMPLLFLLHLSLLRENSFLFLLLMRASIENDTLGLARFACLLT